jgi:hypothetical protein
LLQGEVVIREGLYVTDQDVHMLLEGVYIRPLGELRVMMNSDMQANLTQLDLGEKSQEYRLALQQVTPLPFLHPPSSHSLSSTSMTFVYEWWLLIT